MSSRSLSRRELAGSVATDPRYRANDGEEDDDDDEYAEYNERDYLTMPNPDYNGHVPGRIQNHRGLPVDRTYKQDTEAGVQCNKMNTLAQRVALDKPLLHVLIAEAFMTGVVCYSTKSDAHLWVSGIRAWDPQKVTAARGRLLESGYHVVRFRVTSSVAGIGYPCVYKAMCAGFTNWAEYQESMGGSVIHMTDSAFGWGKWLSDGVYIVWLTTLCHPELNDNQIYNQAFTYMRMHCHARNSVPVCAKAILWEKQKKEAHRLLRELQRMEDQIKHNNFIWWKDGDDAMDIISECLQHLGLSHRDSPVSRVKRLQTWWNSLKDNENNKEKTMFGSFGFIKQVQFGLVKPSVEPPAAAATASTAAAVGPPVNPASLQVLAAAAAAAAAAAVDDGVSSEASVGMKRKATPGTTPGTTLANAVFASSHGPSVAASVVPKAAKPSEDLSYLDFDSDDEKQPAKKTKIASGLKTTGEERGSKPITVKSKPDELNFDNWLCKSRLQARRNQLATDLDSMEARANERHTNVTDVLNNIGHNGIVSNKSGAPKLQSSEAVTSTNYLRTVVLSKPSVEWCQIAVEKFELVSRFVSVLQLSYDIKLRDGFKNSSKGDNKLLNKSCYEAGKKLGLLAEIPFEIGVDTKNMRRDRFYLEACAEMFLAPAQSTCFILVLMTLECMLSKNYLKPDMAQHNLVVGLRAAETDPKFSKNEQALLSRMVLCIADKTGHPMMH